MKRPAFVLTALALTVLAIYLFVTAPPPLAEASTEVGGAIPIEKVLATVSAENDIVRALWTEEIVTRGTAAGLQFLEEWREEGVDAGPLPALFLREAAGSVQRSGVGLGLFLGSEYPISPSNQFQGKQREVFDRIEASRETEYFYEEDTGMYTAMFPDVAGVQGCVTCHNEHELSPKTDWVMGDVMGATTWTYGSAAVGPAEYLRIISAVRHGFRDAYDAYLKKVGTFENAPEVGERWPAEGYYLPSSDAFMAEFARRASAATVDRLLVNAAQAAAEAAS